MSRNKLTALLLVLLLALSSFALADDNLIADDKIEQDEVHYTTADVTYGEFIKTAQGGGMEYYPLVYQVKYEGDTAAYVKLLVKNGETVQEDTPIMQISVLYDEVQMAELNMNLDRTKQAFEEGKLDRELAIKELAASIGAMESDYDRRSAEISLKKLKIELEQYIYRQEYSIAQQQETLDELNERHAVEYIYAGHSGVVQNVAYYKEDDRIYNGAQICTINSDAVMLIAVKDSQLRYGMQVTIETGASKSRQTVTGHVVAATDCLRNVQSQYTLIEVDPFEPDDKFSWKGIKVFGDVIYLDNVLLMKRKAAVLDGGKYMITLLTEDGVTHKRYMTWGLNNADNVVVLQGAEDGDVVIID